MIKENANLPVRQKSVEAVASAKKVLEDKNAELGALERESQNLITISHKSVPIYKKAGAASSAGRGLLAVAPTTLKRIKG